MKSLPKIASMLVSLFILVSVLATTYSIVGALQVYAQVTGENPGQGQRLTLENPLQFESVNEFVLAIIDVVLIFLIPVIVLYIMYAGFLFVKAQGNPGEISEAKKALLTALIGGVIVLGARAILDVVEGTINAITDEPAATIDHIPYV